jgi:large subunit ribosomal protein L13
MYPSYFVWISTCSITNSEKIVLKGAKLEQKTYYRHSRYFGGLKEFSAAQMIERDPVYVITEAVKGMLPKSILGRQLLTKLKTYKGADHPHASQKPETLNVQ